MQTVQPSFFHACRAYTVIGNFDLYHFILLSLTLTLHGGHKGRSNVYSLTFLVHFHLMRMKFEVVRKQFKLNILRLFSLRFSQTREMNAVLLTVWTKIKFSIGMHSDVYKAFWLKLGQSSWPWPWFKVIRVWESKTFGPVVWQSFQSIWMEFGILWRLGVMNIILILFQT